MGTWHRGVRRRLGPAGTVALAALLLAPSASLRGDGPPAAPPAPARPQPDEEPAPPTLADGIEKALASGVAWLKARPKADGSWGNLHTDAKSYNQTTRGYDEPAGPTALALYTLLKCDVPISDPVVKRGFEWLRKNYRLGGSAYEVSMNLLAVTATADPWKHGKDSTAAGERVRLVGEPRAWATELKDRLLSLRAPEGWRYWGKADEDRGGREDLSSTQLATLALFAAERCGIVVDPGVWAGIIDFTRAQQEADGPEQPRAVVSRPAPGAPEPALPPGERTGASPRPGAKEPQRDHARGFAYILGRAEAESDRAASGGMTACGVATLMMSRHAISSRFPRAWKGMDTEGVQRSIYDGLAWLDRHFDPVSNPPASTYHVYYLYCMERAMDLVGAQRLGHHLWYFEMAGSLLPRQDPSGYWDTRSTIANGPVLDTCFALLFLHRATRGGIPFPSVTGGSDDAPTDGR